MTLDDLAAEFRETLGQHAEGRAEEECLRRLLLAAGEYTAVQVELHARPGPWPPQRPGPWQYPQGEHPRQREAG